MAVTVITEEQSMKQKDTMPLKFDIYDFFIPVLRDLCHTLVDHRK